MKVRPVELSDAPRLTSLLNAIIAHRGTTAFQLPFTPESLANDLLVGPAVICCFVAEGDAGELLGFQPMVQSAALPPVTVDIATFAKVGGTQRGVGTCLFDSSREHARRLGLSSINATIRADNRGGLLFYGSLRFVDHDIAAAVPLDDGTPVDRISKRYSLS